jgi:hypothetical protein
MWSSASDGAKENPTERLGGASEGIFRSEALRHLEVNDFLI